MTCGWAGPSPHRLVSRKSMHLVALFTASIVCPLTITVPVDVVENVAPAVVAISDEVAFAVG